MNINYEQITLMRSNICAKDLSDRKRKKKELIKKTEKESSSREMEH